MCDIAKMAAIAKKFGGQGAAMGFVEKKDQIELVVADNVNLKVISGGGDARKYADWPSGVPLQEGARVLVKITPEGRLTGSPGVFVANDPAEIVAIVGEGDTSGSWRLCLEQPYNLVYQEGSDLPFRTITAILYMHYGDGNYAFVVSPRDYEISGANRLQGTMTYSLSLVFDVSGAAFKNVPLWSSTEGSMKRFELSVDDEANATLTDVSTGESKGLGGSGGGGAAIHRVVRFEDANGNIHYESNMTYAELHQHLINGTLLYGTVCNRYVNESSGTTNTGYSRINDYNANTVYSGIYIQIDGWGDTMLTITENDEISEYMPD